MLSLGQGAFHQKDPVHCVKKSKKNLQKSLPKSPETNKEKFQRVKNLNKV